MGHLGRLTWHCSRYRENQWGQSQHGVGRGAYRGPMDAAEHWAAWLEKYGADYATDNERRAAYRDFKANLATLREVFSNEPGTKP